MLVLERYRSLILILGCRGSGTGNRVVEEHDWTECHNRLRSDELSDILALDKRACDRCGEGVYMYWRSTVHLCKM